MKLDRDENDKSEYSFKKIKYNFNKTLNNPYRFNSAYKQRPFTTLKIKKQEFEKKENFTKNNFYIPKLNQGFLVSKYSSNNLYNNKHSFVWGRNKSKKQKNNSKYYAQEELVEKVMKLKKALNKLSDQNVEQKIKLNKQKKELKKQNEILNEVNKKYFFEKFFKNLDGDKDFSQDNLDSGLGYVSNESKIPKNKSLEEIRTPQNNDKNFEINDYLGNMSNTGLKELYKKMVLQNERKDQEILILKEQLEHNRLSNEAMLSNMKMKYKQLANDNNKKKEEIEKLKINSKCTKFNEIMKEKEVYEKEMINIKSKFNKAMEVQESYKMSLKKIKFLLDEISAKDIKIGYMENKLKLNSKNYEMNIENLKNELNKKNKKLKKLENDFKKLNIKVNSSMENFNAPSINKKIEKEKEKKKFVIEKQKNNNFMILSVLKSQENNKQENDNILSDYVIKQKKENEAIDNNYINHNMNFSGKVNEKGDEYLLIQNDSENLIKKSTLKDINKVDEQIMNNEKNNNKESKEKIDNEKIKDDKITQNNNPNPELILLYVELIKRNIDYLSFINELFSKLNSDNSNLANKKIYYDYIIQYFNITDEAGSKIIENLSFKEFKENESLDVIKNNHIEIFNELSNKEKNEKEDDFKKKLEKIDVNQLINIIQKYDDIESGLVYFNQMVAIIIEINLEEYNEKILILTKDTEVFNLFNYQNLLSLMNKQEIKNENENSEKKESQIIMDNQENMQEKNNEENKNHESSSSLKRYEGEFDYNSIDKNSKSNENIEDINKLNSSEKMLKNLAHFIVIEGSTPKLYINFLKEEIKNENNIINVINPEKLFKFMEEKNIQINENEKEEIIKRYCIENNERNIKPLIDFDKFSEKLFEYIKIDDGISNDEDFMKNIKSMDIEGID